MGFRRAATSGLAAAVSASSFFVNSKIEEKVIDNREGNKADIYCDARAAQREIRTVPEDYYFLESFWESRDDPPFDGYDDWRSLLYNLMRRGGDCDDYALSAITLLQDDGYKTKLIWILGKKIERVWPPVYGDLAHGVACFEKEGCFSYIDHLAGYGENFDSLEDVMKDYCSRAFVVEASYSPLDIPASDWIIDTDENLAYYYSKKSGECEWNRISSTGVKE